MAFNLNTRKMELNKKTVERYQVPDEKTIKRLKELGESFEKWSELKVRANSLPVTKDFLNEINIELCRIANEIESIKQLKLF